MKPKVVFIHHYGGIGGAGASLIYALEMLQEACDVTVLCPSSPPYLSRELRERGFAVIDPGLFLPLFPYFSGGLRWWNLGFWMHVLSILKLRKDWKRILQTQKADLFLLNSVTLCWMIPVISALGGACACFVRETMPESRLSIEELILKTLLSKCDGVFFLTKHDEREFACKARARAVIADCFRYANFVGLEKSATRLQLGLKEDGFYLLYVGGMSRLKGLHVIIEALGELKELRVHLVIAGLMENRGRYAKLIDSKIRTFGLQNRIHILGLQTDMAPLYVACDVLVFPATAPHQARPAFEAGMAGLPVIISDFRQTAELVQDSLNGLVFRPNDGRDLAKKIALLYNDPELRRRLGQKNRELSIEHHEFSSVKEALLHNIMGILSVNEVRD